jgi:DNA-directed RNA polymerase beta subunit
METNCLVSHGVASVAQERLLHSSDKFKPFVCKTCGFLAEAPAPDNLPSVTHKTAYCPYCDSHDNIFPVEMPYASKLLTQELLALHVAEKFDLE